MKFLNEKSEKNKKKTLISTIFFGSGIKERCTWRGAPSASETINEKNLSIIVYRFLLSK